MSDQPAMALNSTMDRPALPPRARWRPWRVVYIVITCVALVIAAFVAFHQYREYLAEQALQDAIAEADRLDPGWRFEELEAKRAAIPAGEDSAIYVNKAGSTGITILNTGTNRKDLGDATKDFETLDPMVRLTRQQTEALRLALKPLAGPLVDARKLAGLPAGRYPFNTSPAINFPVRHVDHASITRWLLLSETVLRIEDGDIDEAWICVRASLNIGRSFGDEPLAISQNQRGNHAKYASRLMERVLAQGVVVDAELTATMRLLQEELKHPALLVALRAERAHWHSSLSQVEAGKIGMGELMVAADGTFGAPGFNAELQGYFKVHEVKPAHAWLVRYMTQAVEIVKHAGADTDTPLLKLEGQRAAAPPLARKLAPIIRWLHFQSPCRARIGCACAGLAAERYRLKIGRWPDTLAGLVAAGLIDEVPIDPYDGKALRYRQTRDGIVIYSIGPCGDGKGDALDADAKNLQDDRLEFRLWDRDKR